MKQACEAPIEGADNYNSGGENIKIFHKANSFPFFVSGTLCQITI